MTDLCVLNFVRIEAEVLTSEREEADLLEEEVLSLLVVICAVSIAGKVAYSTGTLYLYRSLLRLAVGQSCQELRHEVE